MSKLQTTEEMIAHLNEHGTISTADVTPRKRKSLVGLMYSLRKNKGYEFEPTERDHKYGGRDWHIVYRLKQKP